MIRGCATVGCPNPGAKRAKCCGLKLCPACVDKHPCPWAAELNAIADDPKRRKEWLAAHTPEESLTTQALEAINKLPGVEVRRTKRRQGARKSDELDGVLDISGDAAPDGRAIYVEMKRDHPDDCQCRGCVNQRDFAARAEARGCVVVLGARTAQQAVDGVRFGLAVARRRAS